MSKDQIPGEHMFYLTNNKINSWKEDTPKSRSFVYIGTCGTNSESGPSLRGNKRPGRQFFNTVKQIRALEAQGKVGTAGERNAARQAHRAKMTQAEALQEKGKYGLRMRMIRKLSAAKAKYKQQGKQQGQPAGAGNAGESRDTQRQKAGAHGRNGGGEDKILDRMQGGYGENRSVSQKASPEVVEVLGKAGAKHRKSTVLAMREEDVNAKSCTR
ncbi:hypothetical protein B0H14DRAFT_2586397 [Mycena olivaceomarginata]|nr:hypothetical protein B0H14DRAFT_2586397 [Mycena olivaceomarginata]